MSHQGRASAGRRRGQAGPVDLGIGQPHPARVYDYLLGGKDNFAADRDAARKGLQANPDGRIGPRENRLFLRRAVAYLAREAGIRQFLDIGTGIPTAPNVHQVAQAIAPQSRVVYVDNDPIVLAHARALLTSDPRGRTAYIDADLRDVDGILAVPQLRDTIDFARPVGLLLIAVMHHLGDDGRPHEIVRRLVDALPSGSWLALSHLTDDFKPEAWARITEVYRRQGVTMRVRSRAAIEAFFDGLIPVDPGLVPVHRWRPEEQTSPASVPDEEDGLPAGPPTDAQVSVYGAVARKA